MDARDNIYNVYMGPDGEPQRVAVGSLGELGTMRVSELGGIPAANLRHAAGERRRGAITAFPDPDAGSVMLPPNTPFTRGRVRHTLQPTLPCACACACTDQPCCGWEPCETRVGGAESRPGGRTARWHRRGCWRRAASSCRRSRAGGPLASPRTWAAPWSEAPGDAPCRARSVQTLVHLCVAGLFAHGEAALSRSSSNKGATLGNKPPVRADAPRGPARHCKMSRCPASQEWR